MGLSRGLVLVNVILPLTSVLDGRLSGIVGRVLHLSAALIKSTSKHVSRLSTQILFCFPFFTTFSIVLLKVMYCSFVFLERFFF